MKTNILFSLESILPTALLILSSALCSCDQHNVEAIEEPVYGLFGTVVNTAGKALDSVSIYCLFDSGIPPEEEDAQDPLTRLADVDTFGFRLYQNFPNPFSHSTFVRFSIPRYADVRLTIADRLDGATRYDHTETLLPGLYQMYLVRLVDSLKLHNGPYLYTVLAYAGSGIQYRATRQMFVISDSGIPNSVSNVSGRYILDYRQAFVGDSLWYSPNGEDVYPVELDNTLLLLVRRRGYIPRTLPVEVYPKILLRQDIVLTKETTP